MEQVLTQVNMQGSNDPCRVNGTKVEYFDCCNRPSIKSTETEDICDYIGTFNIILLLGVLMYFIAILSLKQFKTFKKWLFQGQQKILLIIAFFHCLTVTWRVLLFIVIGHPDRGVTASSYMIWKSSAAGDLGTSLTALCVFLRYFTQKYKSLKDNENLTQEKQRERYSGKVVRAGMLDKYSYYAKAWISVLVYFIFWGILISRSLSIELNLESQDKIMTGILFLFTIVITCLSSQLFNQIEQVMCEKFMDVKQMLRNYFVSMIVILVAQTILVPLTSTNISPFHKKIGSEGWDGILEIQLFFDLSVSALIFSFAYVMFITDIEASKCIRNYKQQIHGQLSGSNNTSGSINESSNSFLSGNDKKIENGMNASTRYATAQGSNSIFVSGNDIKNQME